MTKKQLIVILLSLLLLAGCDGRPGQPEAPDESRPETGAVDQQATPTPLPTRNITGTTILANGQAPRGPESSRMSTTCPT